MCRVLSYLGKPTLLEDMLYKTDNSFITQSYHPRYMSPYLNLAGFGIATWDGKSHAPEMPFMYRTLQLPFYDENLQSVATKTFPSSFLAHIRGVAFSNKEIISSQNIHPFLCEGSNLTFAHNGDLYDFQAMKYDLLNYIKPHFADQIKGTTDSEWMYYIFMSQLSRLKKNYTTEEITDALINTLSILQEIRRKRNITINSPVNLFIANGDFIAATRYTFDYGWEPVQSTAFSQSEYHSLWYTFGEEYGLFEDRYQMKDRSNRSSILLASEPLTQDTSTWLEVPEYTLICARKAGKVIEIVSRDINL